MEAFHQVDNDVIPYKKLEFNKTSLANHNPTINQIETIFENLMNIINELAFKTVAGLSNTKLVIYILFEGDSPFPPLFLNPNPNPNPNLPLDSDSDSE